MKLFSGLKNIRLTTAIAALVLTSIAVTVIAYTATVYIDLRGQATRQSIAKQASDLQVAATVYEKRLPGSVVTWADEGGIATFQTYAIPFFYDTAAVDALTRVTGDASAIFAFDAASGTFTAKTSSFVLPDGTRAKDFVLDAAAPEAVALAANLPYTGEVSMQGQRLNGEFQPITNLSGELLGAFFVGGDHCPRFGAQYGDYRGGAAGRAGQRGAAAVALADQADSAPGRCHGRDCRRPVRDRSTLHRSRQ